MLGHDQDVVIIDEIHQIRDPGRAAKILYDSLHVKLVLTGSSSFHIKNRTIESLAGRKIDYFLFPLTFSEYLYQQQLEKKLFYWPQSFLAVSGKLPNPRLYDFQAQLNNVLLYGLYPAMLNHPMDVKYLKNFVESLIFKDIVDFGLIENRKAGIDLLKLLAYHIGRMINYAELAEKLQIDQRTVKRYVEIFERSFIVFRLYPFLGNKRDEIVKSPKIYFYDTGIRNSIIGDFSDIEFRSDAGSLFENFVISEFVKFNHYANAGFSVNFWRTKSGAEVDMVLSNRDTFVGIEIKSAKGKISQAFSNRFPDAEKRVLTRENFFISPE